ncbi:MAG: hypothetical protein DRO62_01515 [Candidatus Altiarchaeales archaeon]|nr:MAG: hypothetical protein DRO62_01515 [Candidatus Altiarchaeales archaeon]
MTIKGITPKQLSKKLVEKHRRFLNAYSKEFDLLHELFVLREKQDQLKHWIDDAKNEGDKKRYKAYMKQKKITENDILKLTGKLKEVTSSENYDSRERYDFLKRCIDSHRDAINYWSNVSKSTTPP